MGYVMAAVLANHSTMLTGAGTFTHRSLGMNDSLHASVLNQWEFKHQKAAGLHGSIHFKKGG